MLVVLGQIGDSVIAQRNVSEGGLVDRTLQRSRGLDEMILAALRPRDEGGGKRVYLDVDESRIRRVAAKVAFGCFAARYKRLPPFDLIDAVRLFPYNIHDSRPFWIVLGGATFRPKRWTHVQRGAFSYIAVRVSGQLYLVLDFHECLWAVVRVPCPNVSMRRLQDQQLNLGPANL